MISSFYIFKLSYLSPFFKEKKHSDLSLCSAEKEDGQLYQRRLEAYSNAAGPSLRNMMLRSNSVDRKLRCSIRHTFFFFFFVA